MPLPFVPAAKSPASQVALFTGTVNTSNVWVAVDITGSAWADRTDIRVAQVDLRVLNAETKTLDIALEAAPGTEFLTADASMAISLPVPNTLRKTSFYWRSSASLTAQVAVWYDIIPEGYV
jgi:hypothetical protein